MRILIATGVYPPESGGPATYTKLLEEKLPPLGFAVLVLPFRAVRHLPKALRHLAYFWKVLRSPADIIYAQDTVSVGFPAALAAIVRGKKFVVRVPGDYAWEQGVRRFGVKDDLKTFQYKKYGSMVETLRAVQKFVVRHATAVVVPSAYMKGIVEQWGVAPALHYNGIDLSVEHIEPERPEGFLIVCFGRDVPWKGYDALRRVVAQEPHWRLKIFSELPRKEAMGWLKVADAFVINSSYEGLSHQLLEAMALGTPIVATEVGGNPELIDESKGILIPPHNEAALYAALKNVASDPDGARARAKNAQNAAEAFSIERTLPKLAAFLKSL